LPALKGIGRPSVIADKQPQIRELLKAGKSYQEIAEELGCSRSSVKRAVKNLDGLVLLNAKHDDKRARSKRKPKRKGKKRKA